MAITPQGWIIEAGLRYSEHIRHMTDEFWGQIIRLSAIGKASLVAGYAPAATPEAKRLAQHKVSLMFSLARDYVFIVQTPMNDDRRHSYAMGHIEVMLPLETKESVVRQFFKDGLDALYRANYLLYRSAYIELRRVQNQYRRKCPADDGF